jgi:6,7-dimethyl-8-ribityllumazine synthase
MSPTLRGNLTGRGLKVGVVVARFNESITTRLLEGCQAALSKCEVASDDITMASVPGSFELPVAAKRMAESGRFDAVVCLGAVIRGETDHYEHIGGQAARGIADVALATGVPVVFGVLTTNTVEQAVARAGGEHGELVESAMAQQKPELGETPGDGVEGNSGYSAGLAAVEMANLLKALDASGG